MSERSYVHDGIEVKMTGRTAVKAMKAIGNKEGRKFTLYEITPVDSFNGEWKRWARPEDLFEVVEKE